MGSMCVGNGRSSVRDVIEETGVLIAKVDRKE